MNKRTLLGGVGGLLATLPFSATATYGLFTHGEGLRALGQGGVSVVAGEDAGSIASNPANLFGLGNRYDVGIDLLIADANSAITGNAAGPDQRYKADGKRNYFVPQGGLALRLSERLAAGFSIASAGLGPDYPDNPYQRFGADPSVRIALAQSTLVNALAYELAPGQVIGASLNLAYQLFELDGLEALSSASQSPQRFSDQDTDDAFGLGVTVGISSSVTPWLAAGAAYRSKTWTGRMHRYEGLIPDRGRLETPAMYAAGIALTPASGWKIAVEAQRVEYASEVAFRNDLAPLEQGHLFGSADGPGFGWRDQNIYKLGITYRASPAVTLRVGYSYATQLIPPDSTFLCILAPATSQQHYTAGASYLRDGWELNAYGAIAERSRIGGGGSIPAAFGGGEADLEFKMIGVGLSLGRRFGE